MKHSVEFKMPKIFGKKKVEETQEKMEVNHAVEIKLPEIFGKKKVEDVDMNKNKIMIIGGAAVAVFAMGFLIGHYKGATRTPQNIFIMK